MATTGFASPFVLNLSKHDMFSPFDRLKAKGCVHSAGFDDMGKRFTREVPIR